jgi:hypothetical protein
MEGEKQVSEIGGIEVVSNETPKLRPFFEVRVGNPTGEHKHYKIYADGTVEGFEDGDKPVMVINRLDRLIHGTLFVDEDMAKSLLES